MANNITKPELSIHDALVGEILGELVVLRQEIAEFRSNVVPVAENVEKAGELVSYRIREHTQALCAQLDDSTNKVGIAAKEFLHVRELLMAELGVKTANQFENKLDLIAQRMSVVRRTELFVASLTSAVITVVLVITTLRLA